LEINDNLLQTFPPSIKHLADLREIVAQRNKIERLPCEFMFLRNLTKLNLSENNLQSVSQLKGLNRLEKLVIKKNKISMLSGEVIKSWKSIRQIELDGNMLTDIPSEISSLSKTLKILCCSYNKIRVLPDSIGSLTFLERFNLRFNLIESLPKSITKCKKLSKLHLDGNSTLTKPPIEICTQGIMKVMHWFDDEEAAR